VNIGNNNDRRFPPPWTVEDNGACYVVHDANGQALSYVHYKAEPRPVDGSQPADALRRAADCCQYRQAAGVAKRRAAPTPPLGFSSQQFVGRR
jgi:hypothetical protein